MNTEPHTDEDFGRTMGTALGFLAAGPAWVSRAWG